MATLIDNANALKSVFIDIKNAIINKGVSVPNGTPVTDYANLINNIKSGGQSAVLPEMQDKTITENGVYTSDYPYYGLGTVTVKTEDQWLKRAECLDYMFYCKPYIDFTEFNVYDAYSINYMFYKCAPLKEMTLNGTAISVGEFAFGYCPKLETVTFNCEVNTTSIPSTSSKTSSVNHMFYNSSTDVDCLNVHFKGKAYIYKMFSNCKAPNIKITIDYDGDDWNINGYASFSGASNLKTVDLPAFNFTNCAYMFENCSSLTSVELDTSACTSMSYFFNGCSALKSITLSSVRSMGSTSSSTLKNIISSSSTALENFTINDTDTTVASIDLHYAEKLTVESMLSIFNSLKPRETAQTSSSAYNGVVILGETNLAKLTEEQKAIATNKNWMLV